jgi:hypothetical protein
MEVIMTDEIICYFLIENGVVIQKSYPYVEGWIEGPEYVAPGYLYVDGIFTAPPPPVPTYEEYLGAATDELQSRQRQANAQVTALSGRVTTLDYLINQQDPDDEDYIEPSAAEIAELPVRKAQLKSWNSYNVKLGRVSMAAGWPQTPAWPVMPEPYTNETSAVAFPTA